MKTPRWFNRNRVLSNARIIAALVLILAAAVMAFIAASPRAVAQQATAPTTETRVETETIHQAEIMPEEPEPEAPDPAATVYTVPYATVRSGKNDNSNYDLKVIITQPAACTSANPTCIAQVGVHGGGWVEGKPVAASADWTGSEIVVFDIEYRMPCNPNNAGFPNAADLCPAGCDASSHLLPGNNLCDLHRYPVPLIDVKTALKWVSLNAASYGANPNKLICKGSSAGGHLCMLAATWDNANSIGLTPAEKASVVAAGTVKPDYVISISGPLNHEIADQYRRGIFASAPYDSTPYSFPRIGVMDYAIRNRENLINLSGQFSLNRWKDASPWWHAQAYETKGMLLFSSKGEMVANRYETLSVNKKTTNLDSKVESCVVEGLDHGHENNPINLYGDPDPALCEITDTTKWTMTKIAYAREWLLGRSSW